LNRNNQSVNSSSEVNNLPTKTEIAGGVIVLIVICGLLFLTFGPSGRPVTEEIEREKLLEGYFVCYNGPKWFTETAMKLASRHGAGQTDPNHGTISIFAEDRGHHNARMDVYIGCVLSNGVKPIYIGQALVYLDSKDARDRCLQKIRERLANDVWDARDDLNPPKK